MTDEEKEERKKRERKIQFAIILSAAAVTAFYLFISYSTKNINFYIVPETAASYSSSAEKSPEKSGTSEGETASSVLPGGLSSADGLSKEEEETSGGGEKEVLAAKSVNINTADQEELERLPGIGPKLAERILQYREENGGFSDIEDLKSVDGIGEKTLEKLRDYITTE